jgi:hypothetical protein
MTREGQLRRARHFLGLPHPAVDDDVSKVLRYIEFRDQAFRATKQRHSKPMKRAARSLLQALGRGHKAGLPVPASSYLLWYHHIATAPSGPPKRADGFKKRLALQGAFWLLSDRNQPCLASRNGDWCKLAAILYGDPKADMLPQCRALRTLFRLEPGQN